MRTGKFEERSAVEQHGASSGDLVPGRPEDVEQLGAADIQSHA